MNSEILCHNFTLRVSTEAFKSRTLSSIYKLLTLDALSQSPLSLIYLLLYNTSSQATESDPYGSEPVSSNSFNVCLAEIGETPFSKSRAKTVD